MVKITAEYVGGLRCRLTHEPSGSRIETDAPKDNMGKGEAFSPTDLAASSLLSCIMTTLAIYAQRHGKDLPGMSGEVLKEMSEDKPRRIKKLTVTVKMPKDLTEEERPIYERVGSSCPVHKSLGPDTIVETTYLYTA
jgi:putative redox protein